MEGGEGKMVIGMQGETRDRVRDQRIERIEELVSPATLLRELPLGEAREKAVVRGRGEVGNVLDGADSRVMVVVGPCSVHDPVAALEYAGNLAEVAKQFSEELLTVMRVYFEKPRTTTGWKGLINDPHLDGSGDVNAGLRMARALLLQVLDLGLPVGCEFLDPITPQYIADTVSWGAIGARTTESQIHRQLGSGLSMPIVFKNRTDGDIQVAVDAVRPAAVPQACAGVETAGVDDARGNLFVGARCYLAPTWRSGGVLNDRLQRAISDLGARPQAIGAETHDRLMATVSHLPHVVANVLVGQAAAELTRDSERMPEVGPSFRDTTRVAGANPAIWGDIFSTNRDAVAEAIEAVGGRLREAAALIRAGDRDAVAAWHAAAAADRQRLLEADLAGGLLHELRVVVVNRPGIVAELALALGEAGVNIEDMALHPAPDMRSGAVSLWVAGAEQAERAVALVRDLGHSATVIGPAGA